MMERLGDDARRLLTAAGVPAAGRLAEIVRAWPQAVGDAISRNAWPQRLTRDDTLHVATSSSAWAFELAQLAPDVLDRLRAAVFDSAPASLRFAPGRVPAAGPADDSPGRVDTERPTPADRREGAAIAASINDLELREIVARAAAASLARIRSDRGVW
jgi:predicted nucleic acid-binding Zn ribbon protein